MSILEEDKLNELKTKFAELDFQDPDFTKKVEEIVNETLKGNVDKIGTLAESKTIDEALEEEKEGFDELEELRKEGVLAELDDKDLESALNQQAADGIVDEEAEKKSLEREGFVAEAMKKSTPEDILEEILKQLEEIVEEKKKAIDKKIEENEAMRKKVAAREKLKVSRTKVSNLHQKTKNYKGTEGKKLNQNVEAAIVNFDRQLEQLKAETTRDGVEITDAALDQEQKKLEDEKKNLEDMLKGLKESYKKENTKKLNLVLIEKQIDDIANSITSNMKPEELSEKTIELWDIYDRNKKDYNDEIREIFKEKMVTIRTEDYKGREEEVVLNLGTIVDSRLMNDARETYMVHTSKKEKTKEDEEKIQFCRNKYEKYKYVLETICGDNIEVLPLMSEEEYIDEFETMEKDAGKEGFFGGGKKANKIAQEMQGIYATLAPFIGNIATNGIIPAYNKVVEKLRNNKAVYEDNLPPLTLLRENKEKRTSFVPQIETPLPEGQSVNVSEIEAGLNQIANNIIEQEENGGHGEIDD